MVTSIWYTRYMRGFISTDTTQACSCQLGLGNIFDSSGRGSSSPRVPIVTADLFPEDLMLSTVANIVCNAHYYKFCYTSSFNILMNSLHAIHKLGDNQHHMNLL